MAGNAFDQKEIPQEEVVFAFKWIIQPHNSFPSPSVNKERVGTMLNISEKSAHTQREKVHYHNPK